MARAPRRDVSSGGAADLTNALRAFASGLPETTEGVACAGTSLESRTVEVRKKAFLFLRPTEARLKLRESLPEAMHLAATAPDRWRVGSLGWVAVTLPGATEADRAVLMRWVEESRRLTAPQDLLESTAPRGTPPARSAGARTPAKRAGKRAARAKKPATKTRTKPRRPRRSS